MLKGGAKVVQKSWLFCKGFEIIFKVSTLSLQEGRNTISKQLFVKMSEFSYVKVQQMLQIKAYI